LHSRFCSWTRPGAYRYGADGVVVLGDVGCWLLVVGWVRYFGLKAEWRRVAHGRVVDKNTWYQQQQAAQLSAATRYSCSSDCFAGPRSCNARWIDAIALLYGGVSG
jgi:hypothetical protein